MFSWLSSNDGGARMLPGTIWDVLLLGVDVTGEVIRSDAVDSVPDGGSDLGGN